MVHTGNMSADRAKPGKIETVAAYLSRVTKDGGGKPVRSDDLLNHIRELRSRKALTSASREPQTPTQPNDQRAAEMHAQQPRPSQELSDRAKIAWIAHYKIVGMFLGYLTAAYHPKERLLQHIDTAHKLGLLNGSGAQRASIIVTKNFED